MIAFKAGVDVLETDTLGGSSLNVEPKARQFREMVEGLETGIIRGCRGTTPERIEGVAGEIAIRPSPLWPPAPPGVGDEPGPP